MIFLNFFQSSLPPDSFPSPFILGVSAAIFAAFDMETRETNYSVLACKEPNQHGLLIY